METGTPFSDRGSPRLGYFSFFTTQNSRDFRICAGVSEKVDRFAPGGKPDGSDRRLSYLITIRYL
jgi:hypothetical protein